MKYFLSIFLFCFAFICKSQAPPDNLSITPNPFQKRTNASFSFSQTDTVSLTIYNIIGQPIISLLTNSIMPSGYYQDSIIMDSYSDGIYIVFLQLGNRKQINKKIIKSATAGVNELSFKNEIKIYPNPASNELYISSEQNEFQNSEIEITNTLGQVVFKLPFAKEIDVSKLANGFYNLKIASPSKQIYYSKFIKE